MSQATTRILVNLQDSTNLNFTECLYGSCKVGFVNMPASQTDLLTQICFALSCYGNLSIILRN